MLKAFVDMKSFIAKRVKRHFWNFKSKGTIV